jgi:large subunit ribosomal protein L19
MRTLLCRNDGTNAPDLKEDTPMDLLKAFTSSQLKTDLPLLTVGDLVKVHVKIKEGNRERIQIFEGNIIAMKHGGINESITVRRISYGVGVEKVFPVHAPNVAKIDVVRHGKIRRAKLYYLRGRVGKRARIKQSI